MSRTFRRSTLTALLACVALLALVAAGPATAPVRSLWTATTADGTEWFVRAATDAGGDPRWAVSTRGTGATSPVVDQVAFHRPPAQLAAFGSRLAALFADGSWSLASADGVAPGPALPAGFHAVAIASGRGSLSFLATRTDGPAALLEWDGKSYRIVADLPAGAAVDARARLLVDRTSALVATRDRDGYALYARRDDAWKAVRTDEPLRGDELWLLQDDRLVPTAVVRDAGRWSARAIGNDGTIGPARPIAVDGASGDADASMATGGEFRLAWLDGGRIVEQKFGADGRPLGGPRRSTATVAPGARAPSAIDRALSWLAMASMALILLLAGRRRGDGGENEGQRGRAPALPTPAPLGRRLAAGLVDAWPLYVACGIVAAMHDGSDSIVRLDARRDQWIVAAGTVAYVLVCLASEIAFARTFGKLIFGLRVVTADAANVRPTAGPLAVRNLLRLLDLNLVPLLLVPLTAQRQRLGDMAAGTVVVEAAPKSPAEPADKPD